MQGQHLMQQMNQNLMGSYASPTTVTTDLIQQYLDENKQLILAILDNQNSGKVEECARNQAKLQHNLMYLAAIADSQPPQASLAQYPQSMMMQSGGPRYIPSSQQQQQQQQQQSNLLTQHHQSQLNMSAARNPMQLYSHSSHSQQPSLSPLHSSSLSSGFSLLHGDSPAGASGTAGGGTAGGFLYADFGRGGTGTGRESEGGKEEGMYLKRSEDES